jgi:MFS family permease
MLSFLVQNARWLGAGALLTLASGFGQTWFIALFAGFIKDEHGLSDGAWGSLYTIATLAAAALMFWRGGLADRMPLGRLAPATAAVFALAALGFALGSSIAVLLVSLFALRFCGQGMFSHIAMTAMGRWFEARRGQAVAISNLGHPAGEVILPLFAVFMIGAVGWHTTWLVIAAILALVAVPALAILLSEGRTPKGRAGVVDRPGLGGRHWTRRDASRHWLLPALVPVILTPGFIGTVVFFQQVNIADAKGWTLTEMSLGYPAYASMTVVAALAAGWAMDRFGPHRLLPVLFVPMAAGLTFIAAAGDVLGWYLALALLGTSQGMTASLWGAFLPAVYGTRHLGAVRALVATGMVVATAIGPGVTGILIDKGIAFPDQAPVFAVWCVALAAFATMTERRLARELHVPRGGTDSSSPSQTFC